MTATESAASRAAEVLSRPVELGGLTVPNRIAMAPMTRMFSPGGVPGQDVASYYSRRAAAGVGLIVTEGTYVGHDSAGESDRVPRFHGEEQLAGWAKVAAAVHEAGGRIVPPSRYDCIMRTTWRPAAACIRLASIWRPCGSSRRAYNAVDTAE